VFLKHIWTPSKPHRTRTNTALGVEGFIPLYITLTLPTAVHSMQKRMLSIQLPTHPNIIVNIGASHHIVANKGLLTSLQSIPTKSGVIGNGT